MAPPGRAGDNHSLARRTRRTPTRSSASIPRQSRDSLGPELDGHLAHLASQLRDDLAVVRNEALGRAFVAGWEAALPAGRQLGLDELERCGHEAGERAASTAAWRQRIGETLPTAEVVGLLGITRQALHSRKRSGSVLALPGTGTSHYPSWQFDLAAEPARVRPVVLRIVDAFREQLDDVDAFTIAGRATSPQPELDDRTPANWIAHDGDDAPVVLAAQRAAHVEAQ